MRFPFIKQHDSADCGPACLAMICRYYDVHYPLSLIREKMQINRQGVNMLGISEAAEEIGFRTLAVRLDEEMLVKNMPLPGIFFWNKNHFVVLYRIHKNKFYVADPAKGLLTYPAAEFLQHWQHLQNNDTPEGLALIIEPTNALKLQESLFPENEKSSVRHIFGYLQPYTKLIFQLLLGLIVSCVLQLFLPFLSQMVVDTGINTGNLQFIYLILIAQFALMSGRLVVDVIQSWIVLHISARINISILTDFLIKLMKLPVSFFDSRNTGDILQRMNDHQRIELFLTGSSVNLLFSVVSVVVFSSVLAWFYWKIFLVVLLFTLLYSLWAVLFLKRRKLLDYKKFEILSREQSASIQLIQGMQEIKLQGSEQYMRWNWEGLRAGIFRLSMKGMTINQWQQSGSFFINEGKNILVTFLAVKAVLDGQITLGTMLAIQFIMGQINSPIDQMIGFIQSLQNARISMDRLQEVHSMDDEEKGDQHLLKELPYAFSNGSTALLPSISFRNVSFTYPGAGNEPVLRSIDLSIPKGLTTAIVGTSGSGKTTLLKLLLKFYQPQKGDIRVDHTSLNDISHKTWRSHCGVVMQDSYIFSDTIAQNIAVGIGYIDMERLRHSAEMANLLCFIESLPLGFNTKIGAEGIGISMGQKQRILIARTVYRNPEFIFFDEATNSLDANNESLIVQNLERFFAGKTVVVVAHRLSTVKNADQIIVLEKGVIREKGNHQELIRQKGAYYTLIQNQLELGN